MSKQNEIRMYRVVGVALRGSEVLLHRTEIDSFWSLPGGGCRFGETSDEALKREMLEEMGVEVTIGRLLWIVENFFLYEGQAQHELEMYFQITLPVDSELARTKGTVEGDEEGLKISFSWFRFQDLDQLEIIPAFLKTSLQGIPESPQHIISRP